MTKKTTEQSQTQTRSSRKLREEEQYLTKKMLNIALCQVIESHKMVLDFKKRLDERLEDLRVLKQKLDTIESAQAASVN